nr:immunoglobulin light chain junction region [Macaca mulatta]MOW62196.1 immunoglobulin light chain junction region [Macaca mulatta]MOW62298.1 immunoglobulin light chain junction region [Macaca mulatta]MOW62430.1 immunoglobulin light chain junction region [Macaca mulatta]MOW62481.1 immunoglobulin light chain junction region [Macaca mulatta]
CGQTTHLPYTF